LYLINDKFFFRIGSLIFESLIFLSALTLFSLSSCATLDNLFPPLAMAESTVVTLPELLSVTAVGLAPSGGILVGVNLEFPGFPCCHRWRPTSRCASRTLVGGGFQYFLCFLFWFQDWFFFFLFLILLPLWWVRGIGCWWVFWYFLVHGKMKKTKWQSGVSQMGEEKGVVEERGCRRRKKTRRHFYFFNREQIFV